MQSLQHPGSHWHPASTDPPALQVLVVSATDLMATQARTERLQKMAQLAQLAKTEETSRRSTWLLLLIHSRQEGMLASTLTGVLTRANSWCRGVRTVKERTAEETARAAIDLHRLHFPEVPDTERASRILVLGSTRERDLLQVVSQLPEKKSMARQLARESYQPTQHAVASR